MEIKNYHKIDLIISGIIVIASVFFLKTKFFILILSFGLITGIAPFVFSLMNEAKIANEKERMFLEFVRNLVESVKVGTPISKSIINVKDKPYGVLGENIEKLANQISLGIPLNKALQVFSKDVKNRNVSRALTLIGEAERAGGDIGEVLEDVTESVRTTDKLKKERKSAISTLIVQGYIIFFIFMGIILILQFKILPLISGITSPTAGATIGGGAAAPITGDLTKEVSSSFLYLLLAQGFFSGLIIGKLSEGSIKAGVKHSFILVVISLLVTSIANLFVPS